MATKVSDKDKVKFLDGTEIEVGSLNIKGLREFFEVVNTIEEDNIASSLDKMVDAVQIALKRTAPEAAEDREFLEENMDFDILNRILFLAGGIQFGDDPNPQTTPTG